MMLCSAKSIAVQLTLSLSLLFALAGCGNSSSQHRVKSNTAKDVLEQVLQSWQQGESPDEWQKKSPPVVVQDMDWMTGAKLEKFEILGNGEAIDANLHCQVKLKLQGAKGKSERTVTYLVGTSPVLTVFRSPGP